jgi:hypothetical protein
MVELVDKWFIQPTTTAEERKDIWKVVKRGIVINRSVDSKDGKFHLCSQAKIGKGLWGYVKIEVNDEGICYWYSYHFYGKFKKEIKKKISQAQVRGLMGGAAAAAPATAPVAAAPSAPPANQGSADELKKFKDLLDSGAITQEEYDAKKKQIMGL